MADQTEKEPTMEEILASIRRIISEDSQDDADAAAPEDAAAESVADTAPEPDTDTEAPEPAEEPAAEPEAAEEAPADSEPLEGQAAVDDIFELTEVVEESGPDAEPEPESGDDPWDSLQDVDPPSAPDDDALVSESTEQAAGATFAELSAMLVGGYEGSGNTLEGLVREMLKPMLRTWLDENLPRIVEDMVEREVARIASRRGRG